MNPYIYALLAYVSWGFFPLYWKLLKHLSSLEILFHRVTWSFVFFTLLCLCHNKFFKNEKNLKWWRPPQHLGTVFMCSCLLSANWFIYIFAVNTGHVIESSLGYFINPLVNVLLGVVFLKEKLTLPRRASLLLAFAGVVILAWQTQRFPWIAISLGVSFGIYGLLKKQKPVEPIYAGQWESLLIWPFLVIVLLVLHQWHPNTIGFFAQNYDTTTYFLIVGSGVVTALPLLWFAQAAQKIPLNVMGFFQYIAPSLQFLTGIWIYKEPVGNRWPGFILIWSGLALFILDLVYRRHFHRVAVKT